MASFSVKFEWYGADDNHDFDYHSSYAYLDADAVDKHTAERVTNAGAVVLERHMIEYLTTHHKRTGKLAESIDIDLKNGSAFVGPKGKHHGTYAANKRSEGYHRPKTGQGKSDKRTGHHGMAHGISAVDVGYYLEYGSPRMAATHWMEYAVEEAEEEVLAAMQAEWDKHLTEIGL